MCALFSATLRYKTPYNAATLDIQSKIVPLKQSGSVDMDLFTYILCLYFVSCLYSVVINRHIKLVKLKVLRSHILGHTVVRNMLVFATNFTQ
jgi:hypothetical protein